MIYSFLVLVGTKKDLETDDKALQRLKERNQTLVTKEEGEERAKKIGAVAYIEISSLTGENILKVLEIMLETLYGQQNQHKTQKNKCRLM